MCQCDKWSCLRVADFSSFLSLSKTKTDVQYVRTSFLSHRKHNVLLLGGPISEFCIGKEWRPACCENCTTRLDSKLQSAADIVK